MIDLLRRTVAWSAVLFGILMSGACSERVDAQTGTPPPGTDAPPVVNEQAKALLAEMVKHYQGLQEWRGTVDANIHRNENGVIQESRKVAQLAFKRPGKMSVKVELAGASDVLRRDGKHQYLLRGRWNRYLVKDDAHEGTIAEMSGEEIPSLMTQSSVRFMGVLFRENALDLLMRGVESLESREDEKIADRNAYHLSMVDQAGTRDYWIDKETHEMLRLVVNPSKQAAQAVKNNPRLEEFEVVYTLNSTVGEGPVKDDAFSMTAPEEATAATDERDLFSPTGSVMADFELPALAEGETVKLADHKGKVVFLDFFTTWCPYCPGGLKHVQKLYETYGDKGFVGLAINVSESRELAAPFVEKMGLTIPVALDTTGEFMESCGFQGFPTLAVLDTEGKLVRVISGFDEGMEVELAALIEQLLKAKDGEKAE